MLVEVAKRYRHTPLIRFIGMRSKTDKSVGVFGKPAATGAAKALSPFCEVETADFPADRWARLPFSEEEMEIINSGTNECSGWESIKL